jgi:ribonuclease P protein component
VQRNRVRRRLRAAVHESRPALEGGRGYLWRALPGAAEATAQELEAAVRAILARDSGGSF